MKIKYFGSSLPLNKIPDKLNHRNLNILNASKKRERYLIDIFSQIEQVDELHFITTAYGKKGGFFSIKEIEDGKRKFICLGYIGKSFFRIITSYIYAFYWIIWNVKIKDTIITYNFPPVYAIPILLKKLFFRFRLIIEFEDFYNKDDKRAFFYGPFENLGIKYGNAFIASSIGMSEYIKNKRKNARVIINGGYFENIKSRTKRTLEKKAPLKIIYSGTLDKERGICNLISAFQENRSDKFELIFSGTGPLEKYIVEASAQDPRINFVGLLNDNDYKNFIEEADVCINPQWSTISVNFPSKITMYLSYGKIVLSTNIDSLVRSPYGDLLFFYDENNPTTFWKKLFMIEKNWVELERGRRIRMQFFKQIIEEQKGEMIKLLCE